MVVGRVALEVELGGVAIEAAQGVDRRRFLEQRIPLADLSLPQVLAEVLRGRLNKQIAADLGIDERSVKRHRTNLMRKLEVKSLAELVQLAVEAGVNRAD